MPFALYALFGERAPHMSNESLASDLQSFFKDEDGFSLEFEQLPFARGKTLALRWGRWLVRVSYEDGKNVEADSQEIQKIVGASAPFDLARINRRVRVVFGDDDAQEYTNQIIYLTDFLRAIPGVVIFDPQQNNLVE